VTILEELIPDYDAVERHAVVVHASADHVYGALHRADFG
jgi:hypothetical protein